MPCVILCDMLIKIRNIELNNRCSFPIFFTVYCIPINDAFAIYRHRHYTMYRYDIRVIY